MASLVSVGECHVSRVLVTGGAGYIGSHTVLHLLEAGYEVIVADNLSNSSVTALERIEELTGKTVDFHQIDILDPTGLFEVFNKYYDPERETCSIDAVIHFAGLKAVGESVQEPLDYYHVNVSGTISLLKIMEIFCVTKIVFSSSATVYGHCATIPIHEGCPLTSLSPYGRTKLFNEQIIEDAMRKVSGQAVILRYFNPAGAHPSGRLGEHPRGQPNNLMPFIAQVAVGLRPEIQVYGNDYDTSDGTGIRDYLHVMDLARGHLLALQRMDDYIAPGESRCYNLGTGQGHSVLEMIQTFTMVTGRKIPHRIVGRREGDVARLVADPARAARELGFKAELCLEAMCADLWRWQSNNPNGYDNN